ncbi:MAG: glycoside hydrolase [Halobacteriales archaeon]|nr:glycoside hydrolase [Halobacteriales archaeon]
MARPGPMRAPLALLPLLVIVLAGCTAPPPGPGANAAGWALDCGLGSAERVQGAWLQDCEARASHTDGQKQEIWLGVNPKDARNVIIGAKDLNPQSSQSCVWNGVSVTHDGGRTWKDVVIGGTFASRQPGDPFFGYSCNTDPMLAFSADGTPHYVVELYNLAGPNGSGPLGPDPQFGRALLLAGWKLVLATSHDGGDTWPDLVTLNQGDGIAAINDYSRMTVSGKTGTILTAINTFSGGPFFLAGSAYTVCTVTAASGDGGSVRQPVIVTSDPASGNPNFGCQGIAVAPDGTVVLAGAGDPTQWTTSTDDGQTFATPHAGFPIRGIPGVFNESQYRTGTNFEVAYDLTDGPNKGTLYCIYAARDRDEADIYLRSSKDNGATWGDAVRVNDDAPGSHQFIPNLAVGSDGSVHAFFMDKRYDPRHELIDITHAWSLDAGKTWRNERVTNVSFDGDLGKHQEGFPFIGDYIGAGASGNEVWGAFPDSSNGKTTVVAAARVVRA